MKRRARRPYGLKLWQRIVLVGLTGIVPLSVVSTILIKSSYSGRLETTTRERHGIVVLRPMAHLVDLLVRFQIVAEQTAGAEPGSAARYVAMREAIDRAMAAVSVPDTLLASPTRADAHLVLLQDRWRAVRTLPSDSVAANPAVREMIEAVQAMIRHVGDHANLVLDDDLDAYYLVDIAVNVLPETQERLGFLTSHAAASIRARTIGVHDAALSLTTAKLRDDDLDRLSGDSRTALSEDRTNNTGGRGTSLQTNLPPRVSELRQSTRALLELLARARTEAIAPDAIEAAGARAQADAQRLWETTARELDRLLVTRGDAIQRERLMHYTIIGFTLMLTMLLMAYIVRNLLDAHHAEVLETEAQLRQIGDNAPNAVVFKLVADHAGRVRFSYVSAGVERLNGLTADAVMRDASLLFDQIVPEDRRVLAAARRASLETFGPLDVTLRVRHANGSLRWMHVSSAPRLLSDHAIVWDGVASDVTERVHAQAVSSQLAAVVASSDDAIVSTTLDGTVSTWNRGAQSLFGYSADEMVGTSVKRVIPPEKHREETFILDQIHRGASVEHFETERVRRDGTTIHVSITASPIRDATGTVIGASKIARDITQRRRTEVALRQSEELFRTSFEHATTGVCLVALDGRYLAVNRTLCDLLGYSKGELGTMTFHDVTHPDDLDIGTALIASAREGYRSSGRFEKRYLHRDGRTIWVHVSTTLMMPADGGERYFVSHVQDVTERRRAEASQRESEERFRQLAENIQEVFWMSDVSKAHVLYISPAYERVWGRTPESLYEAPRSWFEAIHDDDRERVWHAALTQQATGTYDEVYRVVRPDGAIRWVHDRAFPVTNAAGEVVRVVGTAEDITRQRELEEQFRQSQKMEAIGQLAGGVAHDFNNILAAMTLEAELVELDPSLPHDVREKFVNIRGFADRAANLTRQLLLFSRRQVMQSRDVDLNAVVNSVSTMLRRIIGADIALELALHPSALVTHADSGMLEQVLLNLAVNARDAMPNGGSLTITTSDELLDADAARRHPDVVPGRYVALSVRDTGVGIRAEVLPKIFEPFFTTKEPGKGTGLGLATVFGIVRQHRGWIEARSEAGQGATFQLFLPVSDQAAPSVEMAPVRPLLRGGDETVLIVEDEAIVRRLTGSALRRAGYHVLDAADGAEALRLLDAHGGAVDLVITDMVMPGGLTGSQLAAEIEFRRPAVKTIFTSGYSAELAGRELVLDGGQTFIEKPYSLHLLLDTVRRCLDE